MAADTATKMGPFLSTPTPGLQRLAAVDAIGMRGTYTVSPTPRTFSVGHRRRLPVRGTRLQRRPGQPSTPVGSSLRCTLITRQLDGWLFRQVGGPSRTPRKRHVQTASGSLLGVDIAAGTRLACLHVAPSWPEKSSQCPERWLLLAALLSSLTRFSSTGARVTGTATQLLAPAHFSGMFTAAVLRRALRGRSWRLPEGILPWSRNHTHAAWRYRFFPHLLVNTGIRTVVRFAHVSSAIASRSFGTLRLSLGCGWLNSADPLISGFGKRRIADGTWSGKWSTVDTIRMHTRLLAPRRFGQTIFIVRVGVTSAASSTGVMILVFRVPLSRFLHGPRNVSRLPGGSGASTSCVSSPPLCASPLCGSNEQLPGTAE